jgi:hypothetical protein
MESLMAAIAQGDPIAKERLRDFLESAHRRQRVIRQVHAVIPGRCEASNPESKCGAGSLGSGFRPAAGPGMTA